MLSADTGLFLPGWGAPARLYSDGLPAGWTALDPPPFANAEGSLDSYRAWLLDELDRRPGPVDLAGHSMGGALAILAAAARPDRVKRLVLISPAGLPLTKPMRKSLAQFGGQVATGRYPLAQVVMASAAAVRAPRAALRLAQVLRGSDLSREMKIVRRAGIPSTVVGCESDTLVTAFHCRRIAELLGSVYRELPLPGGHMWMLRAWPRMQRELA